MGDKIQFTGRVDAGLEANFGEEGKGLGFYAENDWTSPETPLAYTQDNYTAYAFPPFDLSAGIGPSFKLKSLPNDNELRLDATVGAYYNSTRYQSDANLGADVIAGETDKNRITGHEYGAQVRVDVTAGVSKLNIPVGGFVQMRGGFLGISGHGENGFYYAGAQNAHSPTEAYAAPLVGEFGIGPTVGIPLGEGKKNFHPQAQLSLGYFMDTGVNAAFHNTGDTFTQIDATGATVATRNTTVESGGDQIRSELGQLSGASSFKVTVGIKF